jgi:hypothetical protein
MFLSIEIMRCYHGRLEVGIEREGRARGDCRGGRGQGDC